VIAGLGVVDTIAGDHAGAERHLTEALRLFRRAGDRWGLASTLWRAADLAIARGRLDEAEAALQEARTVLGVTGRQPWVANTLSALAEVALLRGDEDRASALLADARDRWARSGDALGLAAVEDALQSLANHTQSGRKDAAVTTAPAPTTKGRT
jgi:ATP/maltotriose-dependent transcriptional regulator MalT